MNERGRIDGERAARLGPRPVLLSLALLAAAAPALGQTALDDAIRASHIAETYASIINFASEPDITAATLEIDSASAGTSPLRVIKFPLRHEFELDNTEWRPVVQATLARLVLKQSVPVFDGSERIDAEWTSYSATLGGGVRIPLSPRWSVLPAIDAGYARLENNAAYGPLGEELLKPVLSGGLLDWTAHAWMVNAHVALLHTNRIGKLEIDARLSGTLSHIGSLETTSDLQEFSETLGTVNFKIDAAHPLGLAPFDDPLFGVAHFGHSNLAIDTNTNLGFSHVNEAGFSIRADISRHHLPLSSIALGGMVLWGDNVSGWKIITAYRF